MRHIELTIFYMTYKFDTNITRNYQVRVESLTRIINWIGLELIYIILYSCFDTT